MVSSHSGVSEAPNPGCSGASTSNRLANSAMQGSQMPAPPPPCSMSIGLPAPPRIRRMRQSPIAIISSVCLAIV